jgi:hypothetical protein
MSLRAHGSVLCLALLAVAAPVQVSSLVIAKEGTREYHQPGCAVIKDGKGLLALTIGQANSRGLKPHPACHDEKSGGGREAAVPPVYVDGGRNYHLKDCKKLAAGAKKVDLEVAGRTYWPCSVCKPPIRKRKAPSASFLTRVEQQRHDDDGDQRQRGPERQLSDGRCHRSS